MYKRPRFLEELQAIREEMSRECDYDMDLFAEMVRSNQPPKRAPLATSAASANMSLPTRWRRRKLLTRRNLKIETSSRNMGRNIGRNMGEPFHAIGFNITDEASDRVERFAHIPA